MDQRARRQRQREPAQLAVERAGVVLVERAQQPGDRDVAVLGRACRWRGVRRQPRQQSLQIGVRQAGDPADGVPAFHGRPEQLEPPDVGVGVETAPLVPGRRHHAAPALPDAQRVHRQPRQPRNRTNRTCSTRPCSGKRLRGSTRLTTSCTRWARQGMRCNGLGNLAASMRLPAGAVHRTGGDGVSRAIAREEPGRGATAPPPVAQDGQQCRREHDVAIFSAPCLARCAGLSAGCRWRAG